MINLRQWFWIKFFQGNKSLYLLLYPIVSHVYFLAWILILTISIGNKLDWLKIFIDRAAIEMELWAPVVKDAS